VKLRLSRGNWGDATSQISSITDSKGNLYHLAVGPTALTGSASLTQSNYYAKNIVSGPGRR
jgi:hypothetical protein